MSIAGEITFFHASADDNGDIIPEEVFDGLVKLYHQIEKIQWYFDDPVYNYESVIIGGETRDSYEIENIIESVIQFCTEAKNLSWSFNGRLLITEDLDEDTRSLIMDIHEYIIYVIVYEGHGKITKSTINI